MRHPEELSLLRPVEEKKKKKDKDLNVEIYDLCDLPLSSGMTSHLNTSERLVVRKCLSQSTVYTDNIHDSEDQRIKMWTCD